MQRVVLSIALAGSLGFAANAMADHTMHHVYRHHYERLHGGAHLGHRQVCTGRAAGTAHRSCGSHTGGPSGSLH